MLGAPKPSAGFRAANHHSRRQHGSRTGWPATHIQRNQRLEQSCQGWLAVKRSSGGYRRSSEVSKERISSGTLIFITSWNDAPERWRSQWDDHPLVQIHWHGWKWTKQEDCSEPLRMDASAQRIARSLIDNTHAGRTGHIAGQASSYMDCIS